MGLTKTGTDGIKDDAVTTDKLAADSVDGTKIADNSINSEHYTDGSIDTAHIADNQITLAKMAGGTDGQIITYDANGDPVAVGPGTDGQVLTSTGAGSPPAFESIPPSGKVTNLVMNGNFKLAQRGTTSTSSGYKTADRWKLNTGGANTTLTQSQYDSISGTSPYAEGHHQAFRIENAGQNANTQGYVHVVQYIEAQDIINSGWNYLSSSSYITLSFWIRSSVTQTHLVSVLTNDGTMREWNHLVSLTADQWTKVTMTIPGDSNITMNDDEGIGLGISFHAYLGSHYTSGSTVDQWVTHAGYTSRPDMGSTWWTTSNATFMLTGVQLEVGNSASDYAHESHIETLNKCKRYCHVVAEQPYAPLGTGFQYYSGTIFIPYGPIDMRTTPTMVAKAGASGAYSYEKLFSNSAEYIHQISLDSKTKQKHAMFNMAGDNTRAGEAVRCSVHWHVLSNGEPFVYLDAEL